MTIAFMGAVSACVEEDYTAGGFKKATGEDLSVMPSVSDGTVVTRAEAIGALKEKDLVTLDVFVEHVTGTTGDGTFMKQYHLNSTEAAITEDLNLLANNWRAEGLVLGEKYNIYVATNNPLTKEEKNLETFNVAALKALSYNEVNDHVAIVNDDNKNVTWGESTTSGNIYKLYDANPGTYRALTDDKKFMMDGVIENWTPDATTRDQVFQPVQLNRAAAKIVINVKFGETFLKSLQYKKNDDGTYTELKPESERVAITGSAAWKFLNFAFAAPVFTPAPAPADTTGMEIHNSDFNIFHNQEFAGDDKHFQITTYTYPSIWAEENYATDAPSLVISIPFTEGTGAAAVTNYHYYRIPIVKSDVTAIKRNYIYVINATISTRGSETTEDQDLTENIQYAVLPWNDENNSDVIENNVESVQHLYLKVNPKIYTLRGDGNQSVDITYLKATGTQVKWQLFAFDSNGNKGNAVDPNNANAVWGWFYDKNGNIKTSYTGLNHMGVTITQSTEGINGSKGTVTVTSSALDNRAIKYMLLRVYLVENPNLYEDVIIRHFPTDNIQSFTGSWSSYHTGTSSAEYTWDPVAAGWEPGTYASEEVEVSSTSTYDRYEVLYDGTPSDHDAGTDYRYDYSTGQNNSTVQTQYRNNVTVGSARYNTNGETNAALGADGYWYWGDTEYYVGTNGNNYDWRTNYYGTVTNNGNYRYRWTNYYRSKYKKTHYYRTRYYRMTIVDTPETGNWVDWDRDHNNSGTTKWVSRQNEYGDTRFRAHVWSDADNHVHYINSSNNNMATQGDQTGSGHTNNHMYVVQISATSDKYVLGKPILGNPGPYQSYDEVVSPAFMIASQLGVVSTGWDAESAAEHCSRYLEVGTDGYRYAGWRLPTNDEIEIISDYQGGRFGNITIPEADRVMDNVLKGSDYFNLSGGTTPSNYTGTGGSNGNYLRCIRDLSAEEIEKLNGFDAIVQKYQAK